MSNSLDTLEMLTFFEYTPKRGETIFEIVEANKRSKINVDYSSIKGLVLGCSDARCEEDKILPNELLVISNAGEVVEAEEIPEGIERILVIGHEGSEEKGQGCGACKLAKAAKADPGYVDKHGIGPELAEIGNVCFEDSRENAKQLAASLRPKYESAPFIFNHVTGKIELLEDRNDYSAEMRRLIQRVMEQNERYCQNYSERTSRGNMALGQNPYFIGINLLGKAPTFSDLAGDSRFDGPNTVFEVKPGGTEYTEFAQGSAQYPWLHALDKKHPDNFFETGTTVFAVYDTEQLQRIASALEQDSALQSYRTKGGRVFGITVNPKNWKFQQVYELK